MRLRRLRTGRVQVRWVGGSRRACCRSRRWYPPRRRWGGRPCRRPLPQPASRTRVVGTDSAGTRRSRRSGSLPDLMRDPSRSSRPRVVPLDPRSRHAPSRSLRPAVPTPRSSDRQRIENRSARYPRTPPTKGCDATRVAALRAPVTTISPSQSMNSTDMSNSRPSMRSVVGWCPASISAWWLGSRSTSAGPFGTRKTAPLRQSEPGYWT